MTLPLNRTDPSSAPNVTPLIDVLLVLLVIFMVITPMRSNGLEVRVPQPTPDDLRESDPDVIVVSIARNEVIQINGQATTIDELPSRLATIFAHRAEKLIFLRGEKALEFGAVARVIDIAKAAGIEKVGLMTR
jgi:biopolymer transport protein ExbD